MEIKMRYPEFLKPGGTIGFVAPSFGPSAPPYSLCFKAAEEFLSEQGYKLSVGENCFKSDGIGKSTDAESCGREINEYFTDDCCDVIISTGGGETMCEDLPYVDFDAIRASKPKWYMGYSDNTNLTFTLPVICDTAAIYGPCACSFGAKPPHGSVLDALELISGKMLTAHNYEGWERESLKDESNPYQPYNITEPFCMSIFPRTEEVSFNGRLIGGCLDCLINLCGTRFDRVNEFARRYSSDGIIWFLEACDLNPMGIRRGLWQLKNAGWFENVSGFIIGRPLHFDDEICGCNRLNAVTDMLSSFNVPILLDVDLGHLPPMMPLVSGALAAVTATPGRLKIDMQLK